MALVLISKNYETYPAELAADMAVRGIPVTFDAAGELVPACADAGTITNACIGFLDVSGEDGDTRSIICGGMMGDDGNGESPVEGTPGDLVYLGTTPGTITATAPSGEGDMVQPLGRFWSGVPAATTDKFVISVALAMTAAGDFS